MIKENQPGNENQKLISDPKEPAPEIPATPEEIPVPIPSDDPQVVTNTVKDYDNSLNALLKKYTRGD